MPREKDDLCREMKKKAKDSGRICRLFETDVLALSIMSTSNNF
ncbi:MAG: hypothetical protein RQM90_05665 [Methanoculleus sp.]